MIIILSNRSVDDGKRDPFSGEANSDFFAEELSGNDGTDIRLAEADFKLVDDDNDFDEDATFAHLDERVSYSWTLQPVEQGGEAAYLASVAEQVRSGELSDRWVFFVHGNNQTIDKNLEKCRKLQATHNVNVIAFSWPSWASIFSRAMIKAAGREIVKSGGLSRVNPAFLLGKSAIKGKQAAYEKAVQHALKSPPALLKVLQLVNDNFAAPLQNQGLAFNLIVHSLGNRVLQYLTELNGIPSMFENAIIHQSDVDSVGHKAWVEKLALSRQLYITHNKRDAILHISDIFGDNPKRLGHKVKDARAANVTAYIDYSPGRFVGLNHGLFLMPGFRNEQLTLSFTRLLNGEVLFNNDDIADGFERPDPNQPNVVAMIKPPADLSSHDNDNAEDSIFLVGNDI